MGHVHTLGVAARHEGGPRRRAHRSGHVEIGKRKAFCGHAIQVRRAIDGRAKGTDIAVAEIVDEDDDEVVLRVVSSDRGSEEACETDEKCENAAEPR